MAIKRTLAREMRVALSKKAQPVWFRVTKWIVILVAIAFLWRSPWFWWWLFGAFAAAILLHLVWRWKTHVWTRPWGGWNDLDTAGKR